MATLFVRTRPRAPERLFEFHRGRKVIACELRYHGEYGVEAAFLDDGELFYSGCFETREMAARWAEIERSAMQVPYGSPSSTNEAHSAGCSASVNRPAGMSIAI